MVILKDSIFNIENIQCAFKSGESSSPYIELHFVGKEKPVYINYDSIKDRDKDWKNINEAFRLLYKNED